VVNDGCDEPAEFDISRNLRMNKLYLVLSSSKLMMVAEVSEYEFERDGRKCETELGTGSWLA
jgi:hypothetical protein